MKTRRFYAFQYCDGPNTTTGGDYGVRLHIAGRLISFPTAADRDRWLRSDHVYPYRVSREMGIFAESAKSRELPSGWTTAKAVEIEDEEFWPPIFGE